MSSVTTDDDDSDGDVGDVEVFVYVARAPLHPGRFARALADNFTHVRACGASIAGARASSASSASSTTSSVIFRGVFRATGVVWIASRPNVCGTLRFDATAADEEDENDKNDDDENDVVAPRTTIIDVDCGAGDWSSCERGACDLPPGADARYTGGDRRQHVVFEGFDMDAQAIKACLDACLLTKEEDEDAINRGGDDRSDTVYCAKSWPSAADVNAEAGVEVVDRAAKHKMFYPTTTTDATTTARMTNSAAVPDAATTASGSVITLGGDVGVLVPEAFDAPKTGEPQSKTFASGIVGHYFPDMPCLRCGAPWWLGESWNSTCANCGADDRCYDANQQPLRLHRRKYGEFMRALERLALDVE